MKNKFLAVVLTATLTIACNLKSVEGMTNFHASRDKDVFKYTVSTAFSKNLTVQSYDVDCAPGLEVGKRVASVRMYINKSSKLVKDKTNYSGQYQVIEVGCNPFTSISGGWSWNQYK